MLRPLEVRHVAVGQVGDERAVRETPAQIIHGCSLERQRRRSERVLGVEDASAGRVTVLRVQLTAAELSQQNSQFS